MSTVITIDGPTSSGKSTVGFLFAQQIGFNFIDTGSIYRAGALKILRTQIDIMDQSKCAQIFHEMKVEIQAKNDSHEIRLDGEDVSDIIHSKEVTSLTPIIAAYKEVRKECVETQRHLSLKGDTVFTGRDVGSEVFPDAKLKFYITASAKVRAKRRYEQQKEKRPDITLNQILEEIIDRDRLDETREFSPSRIPDNAVIVDTSKMSIDQVIASLLQWFQK